MYKFKLYRRDVVYPCYDEEVTLDDRSRPRPRSGHRMVKYGNNLYLFGGFNPSILEGEYDDDDWDSHHPLFKELWRFNLYNQKWSRLYSHDEMPNELASHSALIYGPYMLTYGGSAWPFGDSSSNLVHFCNIKEQKWQLMHTTGPAPRPMYGQAICLCGDNLYVVGGTEGFEFSIDVHCLNLKTMLWTNLTAKFSDRAGVRERYRHEIIEYEGYLLIFGGGTSQENFDLKNVPVFDLKNKTWKVTQTYQDFCGYPKPRKCHQILRYKKFVFVHGGTNDSTQFGDLWRINLNSMQWRRLIKSTHDLKLYFHASAITEDGCIYLSGGLKKGSTNRTNEMSRIWIDIPPLQVMAWEAMQHYSPDLVHCRSSMLLESGIPAYIVKALSMQYLNGK